MRYKRLHKNKQKWQSLKGLGNVDYKELPQERIQIDQKIVAKEKEKIIDKIAKKLLRGLKKQEKVERIAKAKEAQKNA